MGYFDTLNEYCEQHSDTLKLEHTQRAGALRHDPSERRPQRHLQQPGQ